MNHRKTGATPWTGRSLFAATIVACLGCLLAEAWLRAGWLDEYWTIWHSDPANSLTTAYHQRWIRDTQHPVTFYAINWALAPLIGPNLAWRRLVINGLALLLAIPTYFACRRDRDAPQQPALYALLILAGPFFVTYFAEYRSYLMGMVAGACLIAVTRRLHLDSAAGLPPSRWRVALFCGLTLLATNLHYMMTVSVLAYLGCETLWQWFRGSRPLAALIAVTAALSIVPLTINLFAALSVARPTPVVSLSVVRGWTIIAIVLAAGLAANLIAAVRALQAARKPDTIARDVRGYVLVLLGSLVLLTAAFLAFHLVTRNMFPRLVLGLLPIATALIAELTASRAIGRTAALLICANALLTTVGTAALQLRKPRWEYHVPAIEAAIARCPTTRVVAVSSLLFAREPNVMTGQPDAIALGYRMIARKYGFPVHVMPDDGPVPSAPPGCPTIIWLEHNFVRPDLTPAEMAGAVSPDLAAASDRSTFEHHDEHYIMTVPPPSR